MDEKIIPTIVLALNFFSMIGLLAFQFFADFSLILSIVSWLSLVLVAYWVYENDKRIDFLEEHVWSRLNKAEAYLKVNDGRIEGLLKRLEKIESNRSGE